VEFAGSLIPLQHPPQYASPLKVSWNGIGGAVAYEVLKRKSVVFETVVMNCKPATTATDSTTGFSVTCIYQRNQLS